MIRALLGCCLMCCSFSAPAQTKKELQNLAEAQTIVVIPTTAPTYVGATPVTAGVKGTVPVAAAGEQDKFLKADGTWATPAGGGGGGLPDPTGTGMVAKTGLLTSATRTLTGTADQVNISNGDGVSGNPVFSLPQDIGTTSTVRFGNFSAETVQYNPADMFHTVNENISASLTDTWTTTQAGTGAAWTATSPAVSNRFGVLQGNTGTTATGRVSQASANFTLGIFGTGLFIYDAGIMVPTLSTVTETYANRLGFIDSVTAESVDGCFFRYTNAVNSGKFQAVCRSNNTETAVDTGVTVATLTQYTVQISVTAALVATFKINGTAVGTISTNVPGTTGRDFGYGAFALKSLGTTSVGAIAVDFQSVKWLPSTAR